MTLPWMHERSMLVMRADECTNVMLKHNITRAIARNPKRGVDKTTFCGLLEGIQRHSRSPTERRHETWTTV